jgi:carbon-monoxide dehydrogenase medium subunit/6-hydroxypseudooxynicotine dehydrogenase subunit alpha
VKLPPFAYARATHVDEALSLLGEAGDEAKLLAGGQSLVPVLAFRLFRPTHLVDIDSVDGLDAVDERDGELEIGALVRHVRLEHAAFAGAHHLLALAARHIGHVPIRTRGTLGGSLAHADPAAELPVAALALDARVVARSPRGERAIDMSSFLVGPFTTALAPDEMIVALRVPRPSAWQHAGFREFALRSGDFALASAGVLVGVGKGGRVDDARIVIGAVEPVPRAMEDAAASLRGAMLDDAAIEEAARRAAASCEAISDRSVDAQTRRDLVAAVVRDALVDVRAGMAA